MYHLFQHLQWNATNLLGAELSSSSQITFSIFSLLLLTGLVLIFDIIWSNDAVSIKSLCPAEIHASIFHFSHLKLRRVWRLWRMKRERKRGRQDKAGEGGTRTVKPPDRKRERFTQLLSTQKQEVPCTVSWMRPRPSPYELMAWQEKKTESSRSAGFSCRGRGRKGNMTRDTQLCLCAGKLRKAQRCDGEAVKPGECLPVLPVWYLGDSPCIALGAEVK